MGKEILQFADQMESSHRAGYKECSYTCVFVCVRECQIRVKQQVGVINRRKKNLPVAFTQGDVKQ